jgi:hypothetical protein
MAPVDEDITPLARPLIVEGEDGANHVVNTIGKAARYLTGSKLSHLAGEVSWQATAAVLEHASRDKSEYLLKTATEYMEYICRQENLLRR